MTSDKDILRQQEIKIQKVEDKVIALEKSDKVNDEQHKEIMQAIKDVRVVLQPISDTYCTAGRMGKWFMGLLVLISIMLGIILSWGKIFK